MPTKPKKNSNHGGARPGAGRPPSGNASFPIRLPTSLIATYKAATPSQRKAARLAVAEAMRAALD